MKVGHIRCMGIVTEFGLFAIFEKSVNYSQNFQKPSENHTC